MPGTYGYVRTSRPGSRSWRAATRKPNASSCWAPAWRFLTSITTSASPGPLVPTAGGAGTLWTPGWLRATPLLWCPSIPSCTRHGDEQRFSGCCCVDRCGPWMWRMVALAVFPERNRVSIRAKLDTSLRPWAFLALTWYPYLLSRSVAVLPMSEAQTMKVSSPSLGPAQQDMVAGHGAAIGSGPSEGDRAVLVEGCGQPRGLHVRDVR